MLKPQQESVAEKGGELKKSLAPSSGLSPQFIRPTCIGSFICDYKLEDQSIGSGKLNMFSWWSVSFPCRTAHLSSLSTWAQVLLFAMQLFFHHGRFLQAGALQIEAFNRVCHCVREKERSKPTQNCTEGKN